MKVIKILIIIIIALNAYAIKAQVSCSYYTSINFNKIGVGYEFSKSIWSDLRIYGGLAFDNFTIEPMIAFNYISNENFDLYLGAGYTLNYINGPIFPLGLRINPIEKYKNIKFHFEAEPNYNLDSEKFLFYCSFGIRYVFGKLE